MRHTFGGGCTALWRVYEYSMEKIREYSRRSLRKDICKRSNAAIWSKK
jgi:hypothetical protein